MLEHHSNFDWVQKSASKDGRESDDSTNNTLQKLKLASENWDIPIIVTTNVQFFESLFGNRSSRCRKLHNMTNSVIIFDEAQMLPRDFIKPCMYAVHELVKNYKASAIFCTATQPGIEQFLPGPEKAKELIADPDALYLFYKRVEVKFEGKVADEALLQRINQQSQALCIVNTRSHARGLFEGVNDEGRYHLSNLMCPRHRRETISALRQSLKDGQPCRVISTQIMEAGIDVDFPVGFRALAGLDSIIQAAGRVNREGKNASGKLYVFEPDSSFIKRTPVYIQQTAEVARKVLREFKDRDPVSLEAIQAYYQALYDIQDKNAFDARSIIACFEKGIPNFDFKTAAEKFRLIKDDSITVMIPYNPEAAVLLEQLRGSEFPNSFFRKLQPYCVNIYEREFQALQALGLIDFYNETFAVLNNMDFYNADTGLLLPENKSGEGIFFDG